MTPSFGKISLLLAASNLKPGEILDFARWIETNGATAFVQHINRVRLLSDDTDIGQLALSVGPLSTLEKSSRSYKEATALPSEMNHLINEISSMAAGLSKKAFGNMVKKAFVDAGVSEHLLPAQGKKPSAQWLATIAETQSPSLVLHVFSRLRNVFAHSRKVDWPLKRFD